MSKVKLRAVSVCLLLALSVVSQAGASDNTVAESSCLAGSAPADHGMFFRQQTQRAKAGWRVDERLALLSEERSAQKPLWIQVPDASYIKVHFSRFRLPPGVVVEVSSPDGSESYSYATGKMGPRTKDPVFGDDGISSFSPMSITGDTAVIRVHGAADKLHPVRHQVEIDYYMAGYPLGEAEDKGVAEASRLSAIEAQPRSKVESQCGENERVDAACYESGYADQYDAARAVAKILLAGNSYCTAWRVGPNNRLFTNEHCVENQAELSSAEVWFEYEYDSCGGQTLRQVRKVTASELLAVNTELDYALFTVNDFSSVEEFGYFGLEVNDAILGELIYIPQHGGGQPKQIALMSDMNFSGQCEIDDVDHISLYGNTDIGYYCDTRGGSSGSPVVLLDSNNVIALHHQGGCLNSGVKMSLIWPEVSDHFGGIVPGGGSASPNPEPEVNQPPQASISYSCDELLCTFDGTSSSDSDGQIIDYSWSLGDGHGGTGAILSHKFSASGDYTVSLAVEDDDGAIAETNHLVAVSLANQAPTAGYMFSCIDLSCSFDGSLSSDSDGGIVNYAWSFGGGTTSESASALATHEFAEAGSYFVTLQVTDDDGATGQSQSTLTVSAPVVNEEPVAAYSVSCSELSCTFDASGSQDPDGSIVSYLWNFDEGEASESGGPEKLHEFALAGGYWVTLQVEDDQGAVASYSAQVTVTAPAVEPEPEPDPATIELIAEGNKYRGSKWADLKWSGATSTWVDVYRNGALLLKIPNSGAHQDASVESKTKSAVYQVCESGTAICSEAVTVLF